MRNLYLLIAAISIAFFASCEKEPEPLPEEKPFPIGDWRSDYQYFNLTVINASPDPEGLKELRNRETSGAVEESEFYKLSFSENGTGSGSGILPDNIGRYNFRFTWQLSDDELSITMIQSEYEGIFYFRHTLPAIPRLEGVSTWEDVVWEEKVSPMKSVT